MPANYLVLRLGDAPAVRAPGRPEVSFFAEPLADQPDPAAGRWKAFWRAASFYNLPPVEQQLVRFLLLLPLGALVVSVFRVFIGVPTFGMFTPALLGLIFRDLKALPWGLTIFVLTVLVGWKLRRYLDRFHLLLIPRAGALLTLIVLFLAAVVVVTGRLGIGVTGYVALFPLIILTHLVERFWTVEAEDGTAASFKTLLGTVVVVIAVSLALNPDAVGRWVFRHPESLGIAVAAQLVFGRYTGYRLSELYRFRDLIEMEPAPPASAAAPSVNGAASAEAAPAPAGEVRP
jgi:hypothetical protein